MNAAVRFVRDVFRAFTWQKLLLSQLLAVAIDVVAVLAFVMPSRAPITLIWSRIVVEEMAALSIILAVIVTEQAVARGASKVKAYALSVTAASAIAAIGQYHVRHWLGVYTLVDRPGVETWVRRTQMVHVACDTLTYGVLFVLIYEDYRRRAKLLRRAQAAELERASNERRLVESRLAELRSEIDEGEFLDKLGDVRRLLEHGSPAAERRLDELISSLRAKLIADERTRRAWHTR